MSNPVCLLTLLLLTAPNLDVIVPEIGLISDERYNMFLVKQENIEIAISELLS